MGNGSVGMGTGGQDAVRYNANQVLVESGQSPSNPSDLDLLQPLRRHWMIAVRSTTGPPVLLTNRSGAGRDGSVTALAPWWAPAVAATGLLVTQGRARHHGFEGSRIPRSPIARARSPRPRPSRADGSRPLTRPPWGADHSRS